MAVKEKYTPQDVQELKNKEEALKLLNSIKNLEAELAKEVVP